MADCFTLYRGWTDTGKFVWSPFPTKVELRMRMAGVKYRTEAGSTRTAPKGKIPYIDFNPLVDETLGDSALIIRRLIALDQIPDLNAALTSSERAYDMAIRSLLEDRYYFYSMRERWVENYYTHRDKVLEGMSSPVRVLLGLLIIRGVNHTLHGQGTGRHSTEEVRALQKEVWDSINDLLKAARRNTSSPTEPFWILGKDAPTEADAAVFGAITSSLVAFSSPHSTRQVKTYPAIIDYAARIQARWFPDYEDMRTAVKS